MGSSKVRIPLGRFGAAAGAAMRVETGRTATRVGVVGVGVEVGRGVLVGNGTGVGGGAGLLGATTVYGAGVRRGGGVGPLGVGVAVGTVGVGVGVDDGGIGVEVGVGGIGVKVGEGSIRAAVAVSAALSAAEVDWEDAPSVESAPGVVEVIELPSVDVPAAADDSESLPDEPLESLPLGVAEFVVSSLAAVPVADDEDEPVLLSGEPVGDSEESVPSA